MIEKIDALCESTDIAFRLSGGLGPVWLAFRIVG